MAAAESPAPSRAAVVATGLARSAPEVVALATLAVAQPLLDLFGKNPEFFVASDAGVADVVAFALGVLLVVPLVLLAIEAACFALGGPAAGARVHQVVVGLLGAVFGLGLARQLGVGATLVALFLAVAVGVGVALARSRSAGVRLVLRYLALLPVLVLALFVFASETGRLLWEGEAEAEEAVTVGGDAPVVFVMFDELPVSSLLRADGTLNEDRFPAFARLAGDAIWYRNATSVAGSTVRSVPSALTGLLPEDAPTAPISAELPRNLFTLLGGSYDLDVHESITNLCPTDLCASDDGRGGLTRWRDALVDASIVYGHQVLPPDWATGLPAVDQSWEGFLDEVGATAFSGGEGLSDDLGPDFEYSDPGSFISLMRQRNPEAFDGLKGEPTLRAVEGADLGDRDLFFVHESFPHFLWERTPEGGVYAGDPGPPGTTDGRWGQDSGLVRLGLQRHLLQVGYADTVLGTLIDRLEAAGTWDDALVVVTADHGIAFRPGSPTRQPTEMNLQEIYRVPLFVKAPGQVDGGTDDRNALLVDVLPTIVDLLDVDVDWTFDGRSLAGEPRGPGKPVVYSGPPEVPGGFNAAVTVAGRNSLLLPYDGSWPALARVGPAARLVGRPVAEFGVVGPAPLAVTLDEAEDLADFDPGRDLLPVVLHGRLDRLEGADGEEEGALVIALNGRIAGVAVVPEEGDGDRLLALVDHSLLAAGANRVQVLAVDLDGARPVLREAQLEG